MNNKLYVGNLSFHLTSDDLGEFFAQCGSVESARIIEDRDTGRSRGFGYVEMLRESGERAVSELNGQQTDCMILRVDEAKA